MHIYARDVNDAFKQLVYLFKERQHACTGQRMPLFRHADSRNGPVVMIDEPVIVTYQNPTQRVLFNRARDANPFFHLYESLWMLAGRNDVEPLKWYVSSIDQFSDDGKTFNGAYGYRWRYAYFGLDSQGQEISTEDQIKILINHLKTNPNSRRAVLQMWNVEDDLLKIDESKDVCCNLSICFSIRTTLEEHDFGLIAGTPLIKRQFLDMTVFNRSNDLILGLLGANAVHMSVLQEYVAAHLGVEVGTYNQVTNNLHVYSNTFEADKWLDDYKDYRSDMLYQHGNIKTIPLVQDPKVFDEELQDFVSFNYNGIIPPHTTWKEPFLNTVAQPMFTAFRLHRERKYDMAFRVASTIAADDWRTVSQEWLDRREVAWSKRNVS